MQILWRALKTGIVAFFIAGAVVFPLVQPYYMSRVLLSLGSIAVVYGIESVVRFGSITTSGLISDSSVEHSVRAYALAMWVVFFAYLTWRSRNHADAKDTDFGPKS